MQTFQFRETTFAGAYIITPQYSLDKRGSFIKDFNSDMFHNNHINHNIKEGFYAISKKGVIRGMHFQVIKQQAKLVRCIQGEIYDVIVDLRTDSPTYMKWQSFILSEENKQSIYVPKHFAHGYLVLKDSVVSYMCDEVFYKQYDSGIRWNDETLHITWPCEEIGGISNVILSDKDSRLQTFKEYVKL